MENKRGNWGSNIGFLMAAIGSAVGLGNIWGFPYKMGKCGGFTFLLVYIALAIFVGFIIMASELALGRKTGMGVIGAYGTVSKRFKWIGWLAVIAPFLIMSFYSALGGYCIQYLSINLAELSFGIQNLFGIELTGTNTFGAMLTNQLGCVIFTLIFLAICFVIVKGGVSGGIEKFNKIGMPALFVMLVIIIIRALTLDGASEGLKFMFVPGYAVGAGFVEEAPSLISVLATAGGQMFFSLSLAMGAMVTYGSYISKKENLKRNSVVIVVADTLVALLAGLAVIPAAVANGIANGVAYSDIALNGPSLLFVTLQDVFAEMGAIGPIFGILFYLLVLIAAISSAISLIEVVTTFFLDNAAKHGKTGNRGRVTFWVCLAIAAEAILVALDGLGFNGLYVLGQVKDAAGAWTYTGAWNECWLNFMDCWSEGIAMPLGAMLMALVIGWERKPSMILDELSSGATVSKGFSTFYFICIKIVVPLAMAFIFAGSISDFFGSPLWGYIIAAAALVIFFIIAVTTKKDDVTVK